MKLVTFEAPGRWEPIQKQKFRTMYVQPGHYLCLGDNSTASSDSRDWGLVPQRLHWWKQKLRFGAKELALVPVRVAGRPAEATSDGRRGEPVTVLLRTGHMLKVGRDFDEQTFARVVALLERG